MKIWLLLYYYLLLGWLFIMPAKRPAAVVMPRPAARGSASKSKGPVAAKSPPKRPGVAAARGRASSASASAKHPKGNKSGKAVVVDDHSLDYAEEDDEAEDDFEPDRVVNPTSGGLPYYDALARGAGKVFPRMLAKLKPGKALLTVHYQENGARDVDALYFIHDVRPDPDGALISPSFLGASGKAHADLQNVQEGSDHMLHLCRTTNGCRSQALRTGVQHVLEWAPSNKGQLTSSWITPSMVRAYSLLRDRHRAPRKTTSSLSAVPAGKTTQQQQKRAQAIQALKAAKPFSDSESSGKPRRPSALKSSKTGLGSTVQPPSGLSGAVSDDSGFPPLPPPSTSPGLHAVTDDKALMLLKQLAETNLSEQEIDEAAGPVDSDRPDQGKEEVLATLKSRLTELKKRFEEESAARTGRRGRDRPQASAAAGSGKKSERSESSLLSRLAAGKSEKKKQRDRSPSDLAGAVELLGSISGEAEVPPVLGSNRSGSSDSGRRRKGSKKKRKRTKKRGRRRHSSSEESGNSSSARNSSCSDELFHDAGSSANGLANRVSMTAAKRPGRLLKQTLQAMLTSLNPLAPKLKTSRPAVVFQYLQKALSPSTHLNQATQRELGTLALAADKILKGDLEPALEILLQRFKAVESVATGTLSGAVAQNLEVIPQSGVSSLSLSERTEAVALDRRWSKIRSPKDSTRSPSPFRANQSQPTGRF